MAGKVKDLLEDIARKLAANTSSVFCVGDSFTIADIQVSYLVVSHITVYRARNNSIWMAYTNI